MTKDPYKVVPSVYILFRRGDEILLQKRANTSYKDGFYSVPAGHVDGDEPAIEAAAREAQEEVAVTLKREDLELVHVMHRRPYVDNPEGHNERIDLFFEARHWPGQPTNNEPHKCSELRWVPIIDLPDNMVPEVRWALERVMAGKVYSDYNFQSN